MRAKRIDANQKEIVATFRSLGCSVFVTSSVGKGFPDIVVGVKGQNYLFEIKDGKKPQYHQRLTKDEQDFCYSWKGQYHVIRSVDEVIDFVNHYT